MGNILNTEQMDYNEQVFAEVVEDLDDGVGIYSPDAQGKHFYLHYINKKAASELQGESKDSLGLCVSIIFPEAADNGLLGTMFGVWQTGKKQYHVRSLFENQDVGGFRYTLVSRLTSGKIVTVHKDEREKIEVQDSLKESALFFESIFDTIQDGITVLDVDMRIVQMNRAMEKWYGPERPFHGNKCHVSFHGSQEVCPECPAAKTLQTGVKEIAIFHRGGPVGTAGWIELSAFPILNPEGDTVGVVEYVRDISMQKEMEEALLHSERKMQDIIEFLPDPTWVIDRQGVVIQWNNAIETLTGIQSEDMVGKGNYEYALPFYSMRRPILIDLVLEPDQQFETTYPYLEKHGNQLLSAEVRHQSLAGKEVYLSAVATPLYDTQGQVVGAIETLRDITDKKKADQEREDLIRELQEAAAKVRTLSGFLPICASCKKIRDDNGYWSQIETYIRAHSEAEFSHGLCPDCMDEMYKGEAWYEENDDKG